VYGRAGEDTLIQYYKEGKSGSKLFGNEGVDTFISYGDRASGGFCQRRSY
jgi:hypothetical protein